MGKTINLNKHRVSKALWEIYNEFRCFLDETEAERIRQFAVKLDEKIMSERCIGKKVSN